MATITRNSGNLAIDNFIIGKAAKDFQHVFIKDDVCPSCDIDGKIIYSPVLPSLVNPEVDAIVRGKNEHEAGHARLTPGNKSTNWSKTKGFLINALEDLRIEKGIKKLSPVFVEDIEALNRSAVDEINANYAITGATCGPVNEAIFALMTKENHLQIKWNLSDTASALVSLAEKDFAGWNTADCDTKAGFETIEKIADAILEKWTAFFNTNNNGNSGSGEGEGEDADNADNADNGNPGEGENTDNADNGNSGSGEGENTESGEDADNGNSGSGEGEGENTDGESTESPESPESGEGKSGKSKSGSGKSTEKSESGEGENADNADGETTPGDGTDGNSGSGKVNVDDYATDDSVEDAIKSIIKRNVEDAKENFGDYKPFTDGDTVEKAVENPDVFNRVKSEISGSVATFAGYLESSLRTLSRCRKVGNRERGLLDVSALPALAKNLSRTVFYNKRQGVSLNTTISVLIDESGSMDNNYKYVSARKVAIALAEVLNRLNIKFEILGHTTGFCKCKDTSLYDRIDAMKIDEFKTFDENYVSVRNRLGSITCDCRNIDSEALLFTFKRAIVQKAERHIILVLSDGLPSGAKTRAIGGRHLRKVVDFVRKSGVEVYGFGIHTEDPKQYYGDKHFVYLKDNQSFTTEFFRQVAKIITDGKLK